MPTSTRETSTSIRVNPEAPRVAGHGLLACPLAAAEAEIEPASELDTLPGYPIVIVPRQAWAPSSLLSPAGRDRF